MQQALLSVRVDAANPLHHLWCNHGVWWIHYTLHSLDGSVRRRVRRSLRTKDRDEALALRDRILDRLATEGTWTS